MTPSLEIAKAAAIAADSKKAEDITILDLSKLSDVCDYFVICTVFNKPQADAVVDFIREELKKKYSEKVLATEGQALSTWTLLDFGSVIVHIFMPEAREYFRLEDLWGDAPQLAFDTLDA